MYKIVDESILFLQDFSFKILFGSSLHFMDIRVFIVRHEKECEKSIFSKTGCTSESLTTGISHEFQLPDNRMAKLYFLSCNDPAILTLQLSACFTRILDSGESPLASQSRDLVARCLLMHTLDQFFTFSHTQPLHYSHLNTWFLNTEL